MPDYSKGKIYKMWSPSTTRVYYGSTTKEYLSQRLTGHKSDHARFLAGRKAICGSFEFLVMDDYQITLVALAPCTSRDELRAIEQQYIAADAANATNRYRAFTTPEEKLETAKEYRTREKEAISANGKVYREENKEEITAKNKAYKLANKEAISTKSKVHYEANKERILAKQAERKDSIKVYRSAWYEANKEAVAAKAKLKREAKKAAQSHII